MDLVTILLIAIGLAMDAFAVSIAKGVTTSQNRWKSAVLLASFFGGFQALMPTIGWLVGSSLEGIITGIDHWIAFGLLAFIGGKMIYESTKSESCREEPITISLVLALAIATSIDALMVGLTFAFLETSVLIPILVIGIVTFFLSFVGFMFGCGIGTVFGKRIEAVGGIILILIGIRILAEHLMLT